MKTMNMKQTFSGKWMPGNIVIVIVALLVMTCVFLDDVEMDDSVNAGEVTVFKMNIHIEPAGNVDGDRLVIAYLAPKSWNAAANTVVTYTTGTYETGIQTMSLIPAGTVPKNAQGQTWPAALRNRFGFGENVLDDMEWIVFWSDKTYDIRTDVDIEAIVSIAVKAGPQKLSFKPMFVLNHTDDGLSESADHVKTFKGKCFSVPDGEGDMIDFCQLHFNSAQPLNSTQHDFVTLGFQGDVGKNDLVDAKVDAVYLCATAYTDKGSVIQVCGGEEKSHMKKQFQYGNSYTITFWPGGYFNVPAGETIQKIEYYFTNADGSISAKDEPSPEFYVPFVYNLKCQ